MNLPGRIILTVFLAAVMAGLSFLFLRSQAGEWSLLGRLRSESWEEIPCTIVASSVREDRSDESPYLFDVTYAYSYQDSEYTSQTYAPRYYGSFDYAEPFRLTREYPPGTKTVCFVRPSDPAGAVLRPPELSSQVMSLLFWVSLPVGLLALLLCFIWRRRKTWQDVEMPRGRTRLGPLGLVVGLLFTGAFLLGGVLSFHGFLVRPVFDSVAWQGWKETPCAVIASHLITQSGPPPTSYRPDVLYEYQFDGQTYRSNRYGAEGLSGTAGVGEQQRLPAGMATVCYVNPKDPYEAVLVRNLPGGLWWGLLSLPFLAVGIVGMTVVLRVYVRELRSARPTEAAITAEVTLPGAVSGEVWPLAPVTFESGKACLQRFFSMAGATVFWYGIWWVFFGQAIWGWYRYGEESLFFDSIGDCLGALLFFGIGIVWVVLAVRAFWRLFLPRVTLTLNSARVALSETVVLEWHLSTTSPSLRRLRVFLEGREEADRSSGEGNITKRETFAQLDFINQATRPTVTAGRGQVTIPAETMHTLETTYHKVLWTIKVEGDVRRGPDIKEEYPITVLPRPLGRDGE